MNRERAVAWMRRVGWLALSFTLGAGVGGVLMVDSDAFNMGYDIGFADGKEAERDATPAETNWRHWGVLAGLLLILAGIAGVAATRGRSGE